MESLRDGTSHQELDDMDDFDPYGHPSPAQHEERHENSAPMSDEIQPQKLPVTLPGLNIQLPGLGSKDIVSSDVLPANGVAPEEMKVEPMLSVTESQDNLQTGQIDIEGSKILPSNTISNVTVEDLPTALEETGLQSPTPAAAPFLLQPDLAPNNAKNSIGIDSSGADGDDADKVTTLDIKDAEIALQSNELSIVENQASVGGAEVEYDSSPYESTSDETSSDDSDSSGEDYELLDPAEQARRLMEGDGSDDEAGKATSGGQLRTANEKAEEVVEIPKIDGISGMKIEELGNVEAKVENMVLIKAKTTGEYQVLESGSVLCLLDRTVIGVVSETLGRVQEPLYCVRFTNTATITGFGLERGTSIYYVPQHSTFVFTKALQAVKGSDASNIHDEEIGGDEIEFSDDEAEAEYKRQKKLQKQERKSLRGGLTRGREDHSTARNNNFEPQVPSTLSYDDSNVDDELYTPLSRPSHLNSPGQLPTTTNHMEGFSRGPGGMRGRGNRGRGANRGRGDRRNQTYGRQPQFNATGTSTHVAQEDQHHRQQQQQQQSYPFATSSYPQGQQMNMYSQPQEQFQQHLPFPMQGTQYSNHFNYYQPNHFNPQQQQQSQNYSQQAYPQPGQWAPFQQATPAQALSHQGVPDGTPGTPTHPQTGYSNPAAFFPNQFQWQPPK